MKNIKTIICLFLSILFFTSCKSKKVKNLNKVNILIIFQYSLYSNIQLYYLQYILHPLHLKNYIKAM